MIDLVKDFGLSPLFGSKSSIDDNFLEIQFKLEKYICLFFWESLGCLWRTGGAPLV